VSTYGFPSTTGGVFAYLGGVVVFFSVATGAGVAFYCYYWGTPPLEMKSSTSFLVMDPSTPVPVIPSRDTPYSLANIFANGETKTLPPALVFDYYSSYFGFCYCSSFDFYYSVGWDCVTV